MVSIRQTHVSLPEMYQSDKPVTQSGDGTQSLYTVHFTCLNVISQCYLLCCMASFLLILHETQTATYWKF